MPHLMHPPHLSVVGDNFTAVRKGAGLAGYGVVLLSCSKVYVERRLGRLKGGANLLRDEDGGAGQGLQR